MDEFIKNLSNKQLDCLLNNYDYIRTLVIDEQRHRNSEKLPIPNVGDCIEVKFDDNVTCFLKVTVASDPDNIRGDEIVFDNDDVDVYENVGYSSDELKGFKLITSDFYHSLLELYNDFDNDYTILKTKFIDKFKKLLND